MIVEAAAFPADNLTPQQREIVLSFIRKLRQVEAAQGNRAQTIMVMLLPDGTAVFWHGVPAGVTNGRAVPANEGMLT